MNTTKFFPAILVPLHNGPYVFMITLTAYVAIYFAVRIFTQPKRLFA